jgi:hypothetical protein
MISSTALDLPDHRKAALDAILRAGCSPLALETGTATSGTDAVRYSLAMVDEADVYLGIFGHRYGHIPEDPRSNPQGWSVTEHEYRHAVGRRLPILGYLMHNDHPVTIEDIDLDPARVASLAALKNDLRRGVCAFFNSPQDLERLVIQSLFEEKEKLARAPAQAAPPNKAAFVPPPPMPPYTLTNLFIGRQAELAQLDLWAAGTNPVMVVEAIGGMGKSALTWNWVQERAAGLIPGLAGRVWWSFYERGTSMKTFLRHALAYVTRQDPESLLKLSAYDCGQALLAELRARPYLLVLDGFERALAAYHRLDKAQVADAKVATDKRECTNPADGEILRQLVACQPSKVLVSTRLMPIALQDRRTRRAIPGVRHWEIDGLNQEDALHLVREAGVRGDAAAIERLAGQFDRHPLILRIVCGMVTDYRLRPGDFNAWRADPHAGGGLKLGELPVKQRYTHILEYAFRCLGEKTRQVLSRIAVLSDAADYATIAVLNPFLPPLSYPPSGDNRQAIADFHAALTDLEDRGLLQWDRQANSYDLHPVVRGYAFEQLEVSDKNQAYGAIRDHFADLPPDDLEQATELFQVRNSLEIMRALLGSGRFNEAHSFYRGSLSYCLMFLIGAYHAIVELMTPLVVSEPGALPALADAQRSLAMNELAGALSQQGRHEEAHPLFRISLRLDLEAPDPIQTRDWRVPICPPAVPPRKTGASRSRSRCTSEFRRRTQRSRAATLASLPGGRMATDLEQSPGGSGDGRGGTCHGTSRWGPRLRPPGSPRADAGPARSHRRGARSPGRSRGHGRLVPSLSSLRGRGLADSRRLRSRPRMGPAGLRSRLGRRSALHPLVRSEPLPRADGRPR